MKSLEEVIFDFQCNLHIYALNREPLDFEHGGWKSLAGYEETEKT